MSFIKDDAYFDDIRNIKLFKNKNLQKQIYKVLLDLIVKGTLKENTLLFENQISLAFEVSKTPVREALKKLESDELIKIVPQSKTYVLPINAQKVQSALKIREALELLLVAEATKNISDEDFLILDDLLVKQKASLDNKSFDNFFIYDEAFHFQIAKIAKLLDAWKILKKVSLHIRRVRYMTQHNYSLSYGAINEHKNIISAMKSRDIEVAKLQMTIHLAGASNALDRMLIEEKV